MEEETKENQINNPSLEQTPVVVEDKKVKPLTIAILLIAILLIVTGAVYAGMQIGKKQTPIPLVSQPTVVPTTFAQPITTSDLTAGWKTYTNTKYGFTFKYPKTWFYQNNPESPSSLVAFFLTRSVPDHSFSDYKGNEILMLNFLESPLSTKETKAKYYPDAISFQINGKEAFRNSQLINVYSGSTKNIEVSFWRIDQVKSEIDQILSTFKFLE